VGADAEAAIERAGAVLEERGGAVGNARLEIRVVLAIGEGLRALSPEV